jgi:hypothetical protein
MTSTSPRPHRPSTSVREQLGQVIRGAIQLRHAWTIRVCVSAVLAPEQRNPDKRPGGGPVQLRLMVDGSSSVDP